MTRRTAAEVGLFAAAFALLSSVAVDQDPRVFAREGWQYLELAALEQRLAAAIGNLHAQPPLLNALLGLALKAFGPSYGLALNALGVACVIVTFALLRQILPRLGFSPSWGWALLAMPQIALYARWFYEPIFGLAFVTAMLHGALLLPRPRGLLWTCGGAALLSLLHSIFHPLLVLAFCAALLAGSGIDVRARALRPLLIACALALAVPCAFLVKNALRFSVPALTSWSGCNLSQALGGDLEFSDAGFVDDATRPELELYRARKSSGVPNYNNIAMIDACKRRQASALAAIRAQPLAYAGRRWRALALGEAWFLSVELSFVARTWSALGEQLYGPVLAVQRALRGAPLLLLNQILPLLCFARLLRRRASPAERALALLLALYFAHTLIAYFANGFEHARMQVKFLSLIALCGLACLRSLVRRRFRDFGVLLPAG